MNDCSRANLNNCSGATLPATESQAAAETTGRLSTVVDTLPESEHDITYDYAKNRIEQSETIVSPATEFVARPLTKLPAEEQAEAWEGGANNE